MVGLRTHSGWNDTGTDGSVSAWRQPEEGRFGGNGLRFLTSNDMIWGLLYRTFTRYSNADALVIILVLGTHRMAGIRAPKLDNRIKAGARNDI